MMSDLKELLWQLGNCEEGIAKLTREIGQIPQTIAAAEAKAEAARATIERERKLVEDAEQLRRSKERELQDCEAQREKFQAQTAMVKTNAEYTALLSEIDGMGGKISAIEEEILGAMEGADEAAERLKTVDREQTQVEQQFVGEIQKLNDRLEQIKKELESKDTERQSFVGGLDAKGRAIYDRIHSARGTGTARIDGGTCVACHRLVPPETVNRVQAGEVHACGSCGRILVMSVT